MSQIQVPKGWQTTKLREVCKNITSGGTPSRNNSEYFGGNIPWLKIGDLNNGIVYDSSEKITKKGLESSSAKLLPKNTVLIAMYGATIGKTAILGSECAINQAICALQCSDLLEPDFLHYFLKSQYFKIRKMAEGAAQPNINQNKIKELEISFPPRDLQKKIVQKLDYILEQLEETKNIILELNKKKSIILRGKLSRNVSDKNQFSKLCFGQKLDQIFNDFQKSNVPYIPLNELLREPLKNGKSSRETKIGIPILKLSAVTFNDFNSHNIKLCGLSKEDAEGYWIEKNDILIERANSLEYVGISAIYEGKDSQFIYPDLMIRIRVDTEKIMPKFLKFYLESNKVRDYFRKNAKGTSGSMPKISQPIIERLAVSVPSINEQMMALENIHQFEKTIVTIDNTINNLINLQINLIKNLQNMSASILDKAFSGKLVN